MRSDDISKYISLRMEVYQENRKSSAVTGHLSLLTRRQMKTYPLTTRINNQSQAATIPPVLVIGAIPSPNFNLSTRPPSPLPHSPVQFNMSCLPPHTKVPTPEQRHPKRFQHLTSQFSCRDRSRDPAQKCRSLGSSLRSPSSEVQRRCPRAPSVRGRRSSSPL